MKLGGYRRPSEQKTNNPKSVKDNQKGITKPTSNRNVHHVHNWKKKKKKGMWKFTIIKIRDELEPLRSDGWTQPPTRKKKH